MYENADGNYYYEPTNNAYVLDVNTLETRLSTLGVTTVDANLFTPDPLLDSTDYSLTGSSPPAITEGGVNLSASWPDATDILGQARTVPWSMGAYEYD